jgi:2-polyprenyl-6-methoxyphenol hydroxylase-like FAD-dependent oxidoreductase
MRVAVIGAGITGLTTALSLHRAGISCEVFEAVARPRSLGVGINVLPHAMRELTELGLLPELRRAGVEIDELVYATKHGRQIWREARGLAAGYEWPQIAIHRGDFQMLLLRAVQSRLGENAVRFGHVLRDVEIRTDGVIAHFVDPATGVAVGNHHADVLAAADGIHSAVRRQFYPKEGLPKWNGVTLWRSTSLTTKVLGGRSMLWAGHARQKFVGYPIRYDADSGETLLNWICELKTIEGADHQPREDWNGIGNRADFLPRFADWRWPGIDVSQLVDSSHDIHVYPMIDRDPLPQWTFGRVTLLGDAAHPMYPIGSNGATQGIIDARAFAYHLATGASAEHSLDSYEAERRPATERIVLMNRQNGPDQVMELAEQRAPNVDDDLDERLPMSERQEIATSYKRVAGFDPRGLSEKPSYATPLRT